VITILDHRDVDVQHFAVFQRLVIGNAVADDMIDGSADRLGVGRHAFRCVVERRRDAALHIDHIVMTQSIEGFGADAGFDVGGDEVEYLGRQPAGYAHLFDVFGAFDGDRHAEIFVGQNVILAK
jgi:hypothetical protein